MPHDVWIFTHKVTSKSYFNRPYQKARYLCENKLFSS